ncbi:phosphotransferase enzyme family protein [Nocardia stercoris]|uniref:Aminoglycoside phosphotransferase family protein n=1 Tax=Nocardia stercoris TaxID=2483361 RepID=A0A3M2L7H7_9NOCA|nr:aminoglycoside phosphotransferase family protein [Nocardia stercoris]RMI33579.1 aminoglycoside phosphotransferase family protein [Nocardia stercoris]
MSPDLHDPDTKSILETACGRVGLDCARSELLRLGENAIYRLPGGVIARISRPGQRTAAQREVDVSRWLEMSSIPAVQLISGREQPVVVDDRAVTFWKELPPHRHGTSSEVAAVLKRLHTVAPPTSFTLGEVSPFVRLDERIGAATVLSDDDRRWMYRHLTELQQRWTELPEGLPWCVIHGDAWVGNVVATDTGQVILLDLERTSIGPPEWDLVHTAIKWLSFGWITEVDYQRFSTTYGHDVTAWPGFELLRDIREFRMTTMALQTASVQPRWQAQAALRLRSIQGARGPRPWSEWQALA